jgi:hypothetical protein
VISFCTKHHQHSNNISERPKREKPELETYEKRKTEEKSPEQKKEEEKGKYNHAFGQYYFCPVILRLIWGRQNAHAGYVNQPSLVTTEPFSVMSFVKLCMP